MTQPKRATKRTHHAHAVRARNVARRSPLVTLAAVALLAGSASRADARLFFDPADPALAGATTVMLNSSIGLMPNVLVAQTVQNGVEITFTATHPNGLSFTGETLASFVPDGVRVEFDPPVGAVAFSYQFGECFGVATFVGAAGSESFSFPFGANRQLVGANAIGDIARVTLNDGCFAAGWTDMRFVPGTGTVPTDEADLFASKRALGPYDAVTTTSFEIGVGSFGPDVATGVQVADFLPALSSLLAADVPFTLAQGGSHDVATLALPDLPPSGTALATIELVPPPFGAGTFCGSALVNVAIATADSLDPLTADNVAIARVNFDSSARFGAQEICDNAFDDDCDGRPDCSDSVCRSHPHCQPPTITFDPGSVCWGGLQVVPGVGVVDSCGTIIAGVTGGPVPPPPPGTGGSCSFPTRCAGTEISVSPHCCEPPPPDRLEWLQRAASCIQEAFAQIGGVPPECIVGREDVGALSWMGMPVDPNYKEADPPVNVFGHGYTDAGRTMTYRLHYENIGTADAHDVLVIDPLPEELDESTLVIADGGVFDPVARTITWTDPVVPPFEPRSVSFSVAVRSDAPLGTRIRNFGTIVFPDAVPADPHRHQLRRAPDPRSGGAAGRRSGRPRLHRERARAVARAACQLRRGLRLRRNCDHRRCARGRAGDGSVGALLPPRRPRPGDPRDGDAGVERDQRRSGRAHEQRTGRPVRDDPVARRLAERGRRVVHARRLSGEPREHRALRHAGTDADADADAATDTDAATDRLAGRVAERRLGDLRQLPRRRRRRAHRPA